jgi:hypothetical protein
LLSHASASAMTSIIMPPIFWYSLSRVTVDGLIASISVLRSMGRLHAGSPTVVAVFSMVRMLVRNRSSFCLSCDDSAPPPLSRSTSRLHRSMTLLRRIASLSTTVIPPPPLPTQSLNAFHGSWNGLACCPAPT